MSALSDSGIRGIPTPKLKYPGGVRAPDSELKRSGGIPVSGLKVAGGVPASELKRAGGIPAPQLQRIGGLPAPQLQRVGGLRAQWGAIPPIMSEFHFNTEPLLVDVGPLDTSNNQVRPYPDDREWCEWTEEKYPTKFEFRRQLCKVSGWNEYLNALPLSGIRTQTGNKWWKMNPIREFKLHRKVKQLRNETQNALEMFGATGVEWEDLSNQQMVVVLVRLDTLFDKFEAYFKNPKKLWRCRGQNPPVFFEHADLELLSPHIMDAAGNVSAIGEKLPYRDACGNELYEFRHLREVLVELSNGHPNATSSWKFEGKLKWKFRL